MITRSVILVMSILCLSVAEASVTYQDGSGGSDNLRIYWITDEITSRDVTQVREIVQNMPKGTHLYFKLDSPGGNINAAMEIGRLLRKARATCMVLRGSKCYSSCVLVLAGAVDRKIEIGGEVGIHRPYSTYVGARDYQTTEKEYRKTEAAVRSYLKEMNLPERLFEAMVRVPSEKIRVLTRSEAEDLGFTGTDPVEQEVQDATDAAKYGISRREYTRRKGQLDNACPWQGSKKPAVWLRWWSCREAYLYGISEAEYGARESRVLTVCSDVESEPEKWRLCRDEVLRGGKGVSR